MSGEAGKCLAGLCIGALMLLSACATNNHSEVVHKGIVFEPEAIQEKTPELSPQELAALKSKGEIDRNIPKNAQADVRKQFYYYLHQGRSHMQASITRSGKYLSYTRNVFREKNMPADLAYLAIVESGYRTDAKSHAGAAGAWQFIPGTGKKFGLDQDGWTDERMDIYEATEAAASYLQELYNKFQDWPTAIAAYNAGEGKMMRAMKGVNAKNFYEVRERNEQLSEPMQLREETKQYVPRFLAVTKIMRNLQALHFKKNDEFENIKVVRIHAEPATDLKGLTKAISMNWNDFCLLNRHHRAYITSASHPTYVYVPENKRALAENFIKTNSRGEYAGWRVCSISAPNQTWKKLEKYYNVSGEKLRKVNPGCSLKTGELVYLPGTRSLVKANSSSKAISLRQETPAYVGKKSITHTLKPSETLYAVSRKYGVSPAELMRVNHITDPSHLRVGTLLRIPSYGNESGHVQVAKAKPGVGGASGSLGKKKASVYIVQKNDSLWNIARKNHVSVEDLKKWNNVDERSLKLGAKLTVYAE